jgi:hypothetical protein
VRRHLAAKGLWVATGTKKSNQWCFGMKAHLGGDSGNKLIHAVVATPGTSPPSFHD